MADKATLKIEFPSQEHLDAFTCWLCEQGEQDYWMWEGEQDSPHIVDFTYHHPQDEQFPQDNALRYAPSKFCRNNIILTKAR